MDARHHPRKHMISHMLPAQLQIAHPVELPRSTLLLALTGWMDGGDVSTGSVKQLMQVLVGRTVVMIPEELRLEREHLRRYLSTHQVEVLDSTP